MNGGKRWYSPNTETFPSHRSSFSYKKTNHTLHFLQLSFVFKMTRNTNLGAILFFSFIVFFFLSLPCCEGIRERKGDAGGGIKGMFVFGSSLVDNGNNNFLENSTAKADYLPYGMDFHVGPSGRFTNGKNVIDLLGDYLGLPSSIPPFSDPSTKGTKIVHGVNYASGGSGILDNTGFIAVRYEQIIKSSRLVRWFKTRFYNRLIW